MLTPFRITAWSIDLKKRVGLSEATVQEFKALNYCAINIFGFGILKSTNSKMLEQEEIAALTISLAYLSREEWKSNI
jgi:hypothetical protein